ncbi:unnamed protein product [Caenorhabditis angaria]|uniref:Fibronectin type-III domain-containing protein n=1 Tax=Caenorhabditis angaria TaxID=860376 RepID=A0A9P1J366_9PELO|nr:unnamed protein product [Caenorhabditis angaria]
MHLILILSLFFSQNIFVINSHPVAQTQRARIVPELDIIYVEWQGSQGAVFTVRHKAENSQSWKYIRTSETNVRIPLDQYEESKQIQIQIKNERENTNWSEEIIIDNTKKMNSSPVQKRGASPIAVNPTQLQPPLQFNAKIIGPTNVQLKWQPVVGAQNDVYYLVNVKQLTTSSGSTLQNQQIKTAATSFTLGKMISGEKYEMTIRSATSQDRISQNAAIVEITMPRETEYFEIGNLIISSHFKTASQGVVNLTWQVPPTMQNRIMAYHVEYAEAGDENNWQKIQFHGASSSAALNHLKSNTEYVLRIKTQLVNNIMTESGQFRFKTPRVETNPIQKVDVIYSHDINSVKLQWILKSHIQTDKVAGYDVYMSEDKDLPDSQWKVIRLNNKESSLSMDDLKSKTVYYVRVNVRNFDGSIIRAPSVYRFKTIDWSNTNSDSIFNPFD